MDAGASADYLEARSVPKYLRARAPHDDSEARKIRRLAGARHAPADWIERARIVGTPCESNSIEIGAACPGTRTVALSCGNVRQTAYAA